MNEKLNVIYIKDDGSVLDSGSEMFSKLFDSVDFAPDLHKALKLIHSRAYDVVIQDVSVNPIDGITFAQQIKQMKPKQNIVTLVASKDEDKIGGMIESGIHTFVLQPQQLDQALEVISKMKA